MQRFVAKCLVTFLVSLGAVSAFSQTATSDTIASSQRDRDAVQLAAAAITTRDDLVRHLANKDASNPLMKLSEEARQRLLDTATTNQLGQITSYMIADIKSELTPTEAYKVFALFGTPELASTVNNGASSNALDKKIKALKVGKVRTSVAGYYCNAGYCTANELMTCQAKICGRPALLAPTEN